MRIFVALFAGAALGNAVAATPTFYKDVLPVPDAEHHPERHGAQTSRRSHTVA
jgi:hypothetical protein